MFAHMPDERSDELVLEGLVEVTSRTITDPKVTVRAT
jgi:hypothetical protein